MKNMHDVIIRPIVSEHTMGEVAGRRYTFEVASDATKIDIRRACEAVFGVKVQSVNTLHVRSKAKRRQMGAPLGSVPGWKKAIVTVTEDSKTIEFFDSLM